MTAFTGHTDGPAQGADLPADAMRFTFPKSLAWIMLGGSLFGFGFVVWALALWLTDPTHGSPTLVLLCVAVFGSLVVVSLRIFGYSRDSVAVNSSGIWYLPRKGEPAFLAWHDVASVRADDVMQRLILLDATGERRFRLEYQLEDFARLREFVVHHTSAASRRCPPGTNVFHRTWINKGIFLGFAAPCFFMACACFYLGLPVIALLFIALAVPFLIVIMRDPLRVVITGDAVAIQYPGWKRAIPFSDIRSIDLTDTPDPRGNVWAGVVITTQQDKPVRLFRFREGSLALHDALDSAWRSSVRREA